MNMETQKVDEDDLALSAVKEKERLIMTMETQDFDESNLSETVKQRQTDATKMMLMETQNFSDDSQLSKTSDTAVKQQLQQPSDDEISRMMLMETQNFDESDILSKSTSDVTKMPTSDIMSMETQRFDGKIEAEKRKNESKDSAVIFDVETQPFEAAPDQEMNEVEEEVIVPVKAYKLGEADIDDESYDDDSDKHNLCETTAEVTVEEATAIEVIQKSVNIFEAETQLLDESCASPKLVNPDLDLPVNPELVVPANPDAEKSASHDGDDTRSNASEDLLAEVSQESLEDAAELEEQQNTETDESKVAEDENAESKVTEPDAEEYEEQYLGATQLFDANDSENFVENENDEDNVEELRKEEPDAKV